MFVNKVFCILIGFLAFFNYAADGNHIRYRLCPGEESQADVAFVDMTPCPKEPCLLHKRTTENCSVSFTPKVDVTSGQLDLFSYIGGTKLPFRLPNPDACHGHNLDCPLKGGKEIELKIGLEVKTYFPSVQLIVQFGMRDENRKTVFCIQFPAQIVNELDFKGID